MNLTYAYLTFGKTKAQRRELDIALAGEDGESPADIAEANRQAMAALGSIGMVAPRRTRS